MSEKEVRDIAERAKMIVSGYAFSLREDGFISILNLEQPDCAMVIDRNGQIIETNMDPIEQHIVADLSKRNLEFMEELDAEVLPG